MPAPKAPAKPNGNWKKLTPEDVGEIRARVQAGCVSFGQLAREYGVHATTIDYHLKSGKYADSKYGSALDAAAMARREGNLKLAAESLRLAAQILEEPK